MILTISEKGWVVIPADLRKKYDLNPGTKVTIVDYGGVLSIVRLPNDTIEYGYGLLKGNPLTDGFKNERKREKEREQKKRTRLRNG